MHPAVDAEVGRVANLHGDVRALLYAPFERACSKGQTCLLEDISEAVDPTLINILAKKIFKYA